MSYRTVMERVVAAAQRVGRDPAEVTVVAVGKTMPAHKILALYEMGHRDFGENRAHELAEKAEKLPNDIRWHFVGALQSNKARMVRPVVHLLHSMDRPSLAKAWSKGLGLPPPVLVEVNLGAEPQKAGVGPDEAGAMVDDLIVLGLDVRGLMTIPPISVDREESRSRFAQIRSLRDEIAHYHPSVVELSMGMTEDFEVAVEEGATLIRVGRAIFGPRN